MESPKKEVLNARAFLFRENYMWYYEKDKY